MDFQIVVFWNLNRIWHEDDRDGEKTSHYRTHFSSLFFSEKKYFIKLHLLNFFVL